MKVLSLLQPWATLVAIGAKKIETRRWPTKYRGPLAIHASKGFPKEAQLAWVSIPAISQTLEYAGYRQLEHFPFGSVLCVCDLVDCIKITVDNRPSYPESVFGNYSTRPKQRYAWHLANVRPCLEPIPARGARGLWSPPPDVLELLDWYYRRTAPKPVPLDADGIPMDRPNYARTPIGSSLLDWRPPRA